jgi:hypothetical protein
MNNIGYRLTDWIFFFNQRNRTDLNRILTDVNHEDIPGEFITYKLITVFLPVVPFAIVLLLNICLSVNNSELWFSFVNNGSLPIISFGIISAGMPYLLEQLEEFPEYHIIRRRVMAVSLVFLFLSASMYIFQTVYVISLKLNFLTNVISLILSLYIFFFSASIGYKMFVLQTKNIETFDENIHDGVGGLQSALEDL